LWSRALQSVSADILQFPTPQPKDGGKGYKERFRARRETSGLAAPRPDDLTMGHADNEMPCDSAYCAPASDPA
jgi:hypothetical protein